MRIPTILLAIGLIAGCSTTAPVTEPLPPPTMPAPPQSSPPPQRPVAEVPTPPAPRQPQECMALAMYWEARGEGTRGMAAVGHVINNRVESQSFPGTTCDVVFQGSETPPCQFSWWCDGKSDRPRNATQWRNALAVASDVLQERVADPTGGALFFHSTAIERPWKRTRTTQIGGHIFYR